MNDELLRLGIFIVTLYKIALIKVIYVSKTKDSDRDTYSTLRFKYEMEMTKKVVLVMLFGREMIMTYLFILSYVL